MDNRFFRTEIILGDEGLSQLRNYKIFIAGVGGVGGYVVENLSRIGFNEITIVDHDTVDITNINRQIIALQDDVDMPKVEMFMRRITQINPECKLNALQVFIDKDNIESFQLEQYDYVIDCIDSIGSKLDLLEYCIRNKIKIISSMGAGNRVDVTKVKIADISKTTNCGLAKSVRLSLRKRGISKGLKVVYSNEESSAPLLVETQRRPINGTISYMPALFGVLISGIVARELINNIDYKKDKKNDN